MGRAPRGRHIGLISSAALLAAAGLFFGPVSPALSQEKIPLFAPGMQESQRPQVIDALKNNSVPMPAPALAPAGAAASNNSDDPFHSNGRSNPAPSVNYGGQPATTTTFSKEQYEYLKNNAVTMQPVPPSPTSQQATFPPRFMGSQVTGFTTPLPPIVGAPNTTLQAIANSKSADFLLGVTAVATSPAAKTLVGPAALGVGTIGVVKSGLETYSAYRTDGVPGAAISITKNVLIDQAIMKGMQIGAGQAVRFGASQGLVSAPAVTGGALLSGTGAGLAAMGAYQAGSLVGTYVVAPVVAPKVADIWLVLDKKYGLTSTGKYLQQADRQILEQQQRLNAAHLPATIQGRAGLPQTTVNSVSGNVPVTSPHTNTPVSPPVYTFKQTASGTVETFQNGQRVATTTPDYAKQHYGYGAAGAASPKSNLSGFGVTKADVRLATRAPAAAPAQPSKTEYSNAPGKPTNAIELKPPTPVTAPPIQPRSYTAPAYRAPAVNCAQLQQQLYANARSGSLGALCQIEDQLARYCGGPRGNACGGGGGFGRLGGFGLPF